MHIKSLSINIIPTNIQLCQLFSAKIKTLKNKSKLVRLLLSTTWIFEMHILHDLKWHLQQYRIFYLLHQHQQQPSKQTENRHQDILMSYYHSLSINQSIKPSICKVPLKQSSQRRLLWVGLHKEPSLKARLELFATNINVLEMRW